MQPGLSARIGSPHRINFSWLIRLRWGALAGQVVTIVLTHTLLQVHLPLGPLLGVVAAGAASNVAAALWLRRQADVREGALVGVLALDVALLTALLFFSGGPSNPFSFLYLVHIALAAVVLRSGWTWALVVFSLAASGALFLSDGAAGAHVHHMRLHLEGMWVAFGVAAAFIVYFVTRIRRALARREADLEKERSLALRNEKLAALATLAAGAAHELATPLGTIAVVARELERRAASSASDREDVALIRAEVDRCRRILDRMAVDAGEGAGEAFAETDLTALLRATTRELAPVPPVRVEAAAAGARIVQPVQSLCQALRGLVRNAQEASASGAEVLLRGEIAGPELRLTVQDAGAGMPADVLARAGEPFFTTKPPGKGMGLGLFLARTLAERLGGGCEISSDPGRGTQVVLRLPADAGAGMRRAEPGASA